MYTQDTYMHLLLDWGLEAMHLTVQEFIPPSSSRVFHLAPNFYLKYEDELKTGLYMLCVWIYVKKRPDNCNISPFPK